LLPGPRRFHTCRAGERYERTGTTSPRYGGLAAGAVEQGGHDYAYWEKKIDAIRRLLSERGMMTVDELRRGIEDLGAKAYDEMSYYERGAASTTNLLIEKGVVSIDELGRKMDEVEARWRAAKESAE
jgi:hypothetical protein